MKRENGGKASFYHAHFVMNSVNYRNGLKFSGSGTEISKFANHIRKVNDTQVDVGVLVPASTLLALHTNFR